MKNTVKKVAILGMVAVFGTMTVVGCGSNGNNGSGEGTGSTLFVDLHTLMPTPSSKPTPDQPNPVNASRFIAQKYQETTGVTIEWAADYAKPTDNINNMRTWFNQQINVRNCPAIGFSFGTEMQADGMYVVLNEYLERPNHYVPGNTKWKDLFEDWVWTDPDVLDAKGNIVSIPVILNPGSATAVYYNKDMFAKKNLSTPSTWKEFLAVSDELKKETGVTPYVPYSGDARVALDSWTFEFSLAPAFAKAMMDETDYDKDGITTTNELVRAVMEDKFNPNTCREAQTLYSLAYDYYKTVLPTGWQESATAFETKWSNGKVAMKDHGLWFYANETGNVLREFEFGLFAPPVVQNDTSSYAANLEKKSIANGHKSAVLQAFNIMAPAVNENPELLEKAIDFLMYITAPDAVTTIVQENGIGLSAIKGAGVPSVYDDAKWLDTEFYDISAAKWPLGFIEANTANINAAFNKWVNGQMTESEFKITLHREQKAGAELLIKNMGIDTTGWNI